MVLGPVAALLGGGQAWPPRSWPRRATGATRCSRGDPRPAEVVDGRSRAVNSGGPEQLVVGREGQERPFSPDVWGARRPPASTTSTSPSTSSRFTGRREGSTPSRARRRPSTARTMPGTGHVQVASGPDCSCDLLLSLAELIRQLPARLDRHPTGERTHLVEQRRQFCNLGLIGGTPRL